MAFLNHLIEFGPVQTTSIEIIAVFFGLLCVWSMKKESILAFPFGIINVLIYVYICFTAKLYAYAGINVFYFVMSVYGWYNWLRTGDNEEKVRITGCSDKERIGNSIAILVFFVVLWVLLKNFTDSVVPVWDAVTTAIYIVGMWLLARKKIENWILWIAGDFISIFLFAYEKLYFSSFQFLVFTVIAVFGFLEWRRKLVRRAEYGGRRLEVKGQKPEVRGKRTAKSE
jgi:nicotinamide mononucleotide transporter